MLLRVFLSVRGVHSLTPTFQRWSSSLSQSKKEIIRSWIAEQPFPARQPSLFDHINSSQLKALACTLPTLDGSIPLPPHRRSELKKGALLSPGHHLIFCNPLAPERELDTDATIRLLAPPAPFTRRMWAGGRFEFKRPIRVGDDVRAERVVSRIDAKRLDSENPMVLVEQIIEMGVVGNLKSEHTPMDCCIRETRSHVYVPVTNERRVRMIKDLPKPDFSFSYTPTDTTLFRFSALTFNAHRIHLDRDYAQNVEKLPERLVHGPMTALILLEAIENNRPEHLQIHTLDYRATNSLLVDRPITIHGTWSGEKAVGVWAESDEGVVGMVGEAQLRS